MPQAIRGVTRFTELDDCLYAAIIHEEGIAGTAITLVEDGSYDVTDAIIFMLMVVPSVGTRDWAFNTMAVGENLTLWTDGTDTLTLAVSAGGAVTLQRTAGVTVTFKVTGVMTW